MYRIRIHEYLAFPIPTHTHSFHKLSWYLFEQTKRIPKSIACFISSPSSSFSRFSPLSLSLFLYLSDLCLFRFKRSLYRFGFIAEQMNIII